MSETVTEAKNFSWKWMIYNSNKLSKTHSELLLMNKCVSN